MYSLYTLYTLYTVCIKYTVCIMNTYCILYIFTTVCFIEDYIHVFVYSELIPSAKQMPYLNWLFNLFFLYVI